MQKYGDEFFIVECYVRVSGDYFRANRKMFSKAWNALAESHDPRIFVHLSLHFPANFSGEIDVA